MIKLCNPILLEEIIPNQPFLFRGKLHLITDQGELISDREKIYTIIMTKIDHDLETKETV